LQKRSGLTIQLLTICRKIEQDSGLTLFGFYRADHLKEYEN